MSLAAQILLWHGDFCTIEEKKIPVIRGNANDTERERERERVSV